MDIQEKIASRTMELAVSFECFPGVSIFSTIVGQEFKEIKENNGLKVLDSFSDYSLDDGVFVYFTNPLTIAIVTDGVSKRKQISEDKAVELVSLSYIARALSLTKESYKDDIIKINKEMQKLIA